MKLILVPLAVMLLLTALSITGLASTVPGLDETKGGDLYGSQDYNLNYDNSYGYTDVSGDGILYDEATNSPVIYYNMTNFFPGQEKTRVVPVNVLHQPFTYAAWENSTGGGMLTSPTGPGPNGWVSFDSFDGSFSYTNPGSPETVNSHTWVLTSSLGFIALIVVIMGIGAIAGIKVLGSGESEISVDLLVKGSFYLTVWTVLSLLAYPLILAAGFYMFLIYFALCLVYTIGVINSVGSPSND